MNNGYAVPYAEMARLIRDDLPPGSLLVVEDDDNAPPGQLLARLGTEPHVIRLYDEVSAASVREAARQRPVIWMWRRTHDTSPGQLVSGMERELGQGRDVHRFGFMPYGPLERLAMRVLRGPAQPLNAFEISKIR